MKKRNVLKKNSMNRSHKFLFGYMIVFTVFWFSILLFVPGEPAQDEGNLFWGLACVGFVLLIGISLYIFFNRQIVDVKWNNDELIFLANSGKSHHVKCEDVCEIKVTASRYVFVVGERKKLSAYKYMSSNPFKHEKMLGDRINQLVNEGAFPNLNKRTKSYRI